MRSTVCGALTGVERRHDEVSGLGRVERAVTVSASRISPIRITSGLWRSAWRRPSWKLGQSVPTSRWLITQRFSGKSISTGSSSVTTWRSMLSFMYWIMPASVVDLPEPGDARDEDQAALARRELAERLRRQLERLEGRRVLGDAAQDDRRIAELAVGVHPEAAEPVEVQRRVGRAAHAPRPPSFPSR
jgi:hypothetical protein